jgi:hypothetical protein
MYKPSEYIVSAQSGVTEIPPTIRSVIYHMLGNNQEAFDRFINWLAYVVQFRTITTTAWVLHGVQGTGKGLFINKILAPILGKQYVAKPKIGAFARDFNAFMEQALLVFVDESEVEGVADYTSAMQQLMMLIAEPEIMIRRMRTDWYSVPNYANFIFASNKFDVVKIAPEDRRFNVASRQNQKLLDILGISYDTLEAIITKELQDFTSYLMFYEVDKSLACTPMESEERELLKELTSDSLQIIADKLKAGDLEYFIEYAPLKDKLMEFGEFTREEAFTVPYATIIEEALISNGKPVNIPRRHIELLFFCLGAYHQRSVTKFTQFLKHKGLVIKQIKYDKENCQGLHGLKWNVTDAARELWEARKPKEHKPAADIVPITSAKTKREPTSDSKETLLTLFQGEIDE